MAEWVIYCTLGAFSGFFAGLLGIGGGLIIVPALVFVFTQILGFSEEITLPTAIGSSLTIIIFTAISSIRTHHQAQSVKWALFFQLTPGLIVGAFLGGWIAKALDWELLKYLFGLFCWIIGIKMALAWKPPANGALPNRAGLIFSGVSIGTLSSLFGIGGGSLTVPFLIWCNKPAKIAVGTSAACGLPIAVSGSLGFLLAGWYDPQLPAGSLGYIYLPSVFGVIPTSILFAHLGARMTQKLPAMKIKQIFSVLLFVIGAQFLFLEH